MIYITCPSCMVRLKVEDRKAGHQVRCLKCKTLLVVPHPAVATNPATTTPVPIEQTGKRYKGCMLVSAVIMGLSAAVLGGSCSIAKHEAKPDPDLQMVVALAFLAFLGGLFMYFVARFLAWWNHG